MRFLIFFSLLLVFALADNSCDCPVFNPVKIENTNNYSLKVSYTLKKDASKSGCPDGVDKYGMWAQQCSYTLSCSTIGDGLERFLIFRQIKLSSKSPGSIQLASFTITNPSVLQTPLVSMSQVYIPTTPGAAKEWSVEPELLVTASREQNGVVDFTVSSASVLPPGQVDEVDVEIEFSCSQVHKYVVYGAGDTSRGETASIIAAYVLPVVIFVVYVILAIIRWNNPELVARIRAYVGFKEISEEERTHYTMSKEKGTGSTWMEDPNAVTQDVIQEKPAEEEEKEEEEE